MPCAIGSMVLMSTLRPVRPQPRTDPGMLEGLRLAAERGRRNHRRVGICGEAPANYPETARFLAGTGIASITVNPSCLLRTIKVAREAEDTAKPVPPRYAAAADEPTRRGP